MPGAVLNYRYTFALVVAGATVLSGIPTSTAVAEIAGEPGDNSWVRVSTPPEMHAGILAYSGMAVDTENAKVLVFGGGHFDYWGNEVWALDIPSRQWKKMYEPDPRPDTLPPESFKDEYPGSVLYPQPGESLRDIRPLSRHTYDTVEFLAAHGVMFMAGKYTWGDGNAAYCWVCRDAWSYDFSDNDWKYLGNEKIPDSEGASAAYDSVADDLIFISKGTTFRYDPVDDSWIEIATNGRPPGAIETVAEYDSRRRRIYLFGGEYPTNNELWAFDLATVTWSRLEPEGEPPMAGGGYGMTYDSINDVLLLIKDELRAYDPKSNSWLALDAEPAPPLGGRVHGNFKFDAAENVAILVTIGRSGVETWFYRFRQSGADAKALAESASHNSG